MDDQPTCGKGLAEHSALPARLGELVAALAAILENHQKALDLSDENARREHEAYEKLAREHRGIAGQLKTVAAHMAGYRDLPMGRHDQRAMASPAALDVLIRFVTAEQELLAYMEQAVDRDRTMLGEMRSMIG
jgi:hypothetical protein